MDSNELDITGIDRAELLAALFNGTSPLGMGAFRPSAHEPMTVEQAREVVQAYGGAKNLHFDYVRGRSIKVWFLGNTLSRVDLYDRDAGIGKCSEIVQQLREKAQAGS